MNKDVPYIVHEGEVARLERIIKRLWVMCIIIFLAFMASNCAWIHYSMQFESVEVSQDAENGTNTFIGNDGDVNNGKTDG